MSCNLQRFKIHYRLRVPLLIQQLSVLHHCLSSLVWKILSPYSSSLLQTTCFCLIKIRRACENLISSRITCLCSFSGLCLKTSQTQQWEGGEVRTRYFTNSFARGFAILVAYQALDAIAPVSFAATEATIVSSFDAIVFWIIASSKDSLIADGSSRMETNNLSEAPLSATLIKTLT